MVPPRWVYRVAWALHGVVDRLSGGRLSTTPPRGRKVGVQVGARRRVRGRRATPEEATRAWGRFVTASNQYSTYRALTSREIPIVVLEPI